MYKYIFLKSIQLLLSIKNKNLRVSPPTSPKKKKTQTQKDTVSYGEGMEKT
jgi:hypothetical protein